MILLLSLACGRGPDPARPPPPEPLCAPWSDWVPLDDGRVIHCDERRLHVSFPAGTADERAQAWRAAAVLHGWTLEVDTSVPGALSVRYARSAGSAPGAQGGAKLALTLLDTPASTELGATVTGP